MRHAIAAVVLGVLSIAGACAPVEGSSPGAEPREKETTMTSGSLEVATLGGGCFWCIEAVFERLQGVEKAVSGYAGGDVANPTYEQVTSGETGHAEVVQVHFDPAVLSYRQVLEIFFAMHDPTTLNRQGADVGTQYRSAIFFADETQRRTADALIEEFKREEVFPDPIVTEVSPLDAFYEAEPYHQDYYENNSGAGYCRVVIAPKVNKLRRSYTEMLKPEFR